MKKRPIEEPGDSSFAVIRQSQPTLPTPIYTASPQEPAADSVVGYRRFFRRWKWVLILSGVLGIGAGTLITLLVPTLYEARTSIEIQNLNDTFLNLKQFLPVSDSDGSLNAHGDIQTQIKLLQSDSVVNPVIAKVLESYRSQNAPMPDSSKLRTLLGLAPTASEFEQVEAKRLYDTLKIRAVGATRIIEVTVTSTSPQLAADFLNQLCAQYIDLSSKARYEMGVHTTQSLARLLEAERQKVRHSEDALQNYARTTGLIFTSAKKSVAEEKLSKLQDELAKAEEARIRAQTHYDNTKAATPDGLPNDPNRGTLGEYKARLSDLRRQLAELSATYTPDYFKVKRLEAQIASLQSSIKREEQELVQRAGTEYREALGQEKMLASSYANQSAIVSDLAQRAVQYDILEQEVEANRKGYDELLAKVKDATVAATVQTDTARVVDPALPPKHPYSPKAPLYGAIGFLAFSFLGFVCAFVRDRSDLSLREPGEGYQHLGLKELGAVVHVGTSRFRTPSSLARRTELGYTFSLVMESYRAAVTSLLVEADGSQRLLVVTSPGPCEGKTTVTANLGLMLAMIGRRVLLVDGDMRRCHLHNLFGLPNDRGLYTLLMAEQLEGESLGDYVQKTSVPGLSLLAGGPQSPVSAHLLHSGELARLFDLFRKNYDFVLVDTPPVLPLADARIMGQLADGVVMVARAYQTSRGAVGAAYQRLVADGANVLGMILNDWNPSSSMCGYYANYAQAYTDTSRSTSIDQTALDAQTRRARGQYGDNLTGRQRQVLQLAVKGRNTAEIAAILRVSPRTVDFEKYSLMLKFGLRTTAELVKYAIKHRIATP